MNIADILIETYVAESVLLRTEKLVDIYGENARKPHIQMTKALLYDTMDRINPYGKNAINACSEGDENRMLHMGLKRFTKYTQVNTKKMRREIASVLIEANQYPF
jgi:hypothetical protein